MPQDDATQSAASGGSHGPAAWALMLPRKNTTFHATRKEAQDHLEFWCEINPASSADDGKMVPLFAMSEAEIDALEYVVVEGRMAVACVEDYKILRSLLVKVRPECGDTQWESENV